MVKDTDERRDKTLTLIKSQVSFTIFKNKIAIYSAAEKQFVVMVEDKNVSESLKSYFGILWDCSG
ncbi:MAG: hypothetical protein U9P44_04095 [archaeon]|nr:hypothetical protein [archaeon]